MFTQTQFKYVYANSVKICLHKLNSNTSTPKKNYIIVKYFEFEEYNQKC